MKEVDVGEGLEHYWAPSHSPNWNCIFHLWILPKQVRSEGLDVASSDINRSFRSIELFAVGQVFLEETSVGVIVPEAEREFNGGSKEAILEMGMGHDQEKWLLLAKRYEVFVVVLAIHPVVDYLFAVCFWALFQLFLRLWAHLRGDEILKIRVIDDFWRETIECLRDESESLETELDVPKVDLSFTIFGVAVFERAYSMPFYVIAHVLSAVLTILALTLLFSIWSSQKKIVLNLLAT